jgi:hypothetical protein
MCHGSVIGSSSDVEARNDTLTLERGKSLIKSREKGPRAGGRVHDYMAYYVRLYDDKLTDQSRSWSQGGVA